jgi:enterochelin esterase family protein
VPIDILRCDSRALRDNPLKDPHVRELHVVVPDDLKPGESLPCLWWLAGHAGVGRGMLAHDPWQEGIAERIARLGLRMIIALPDVFTKFGGSQYLGSSAAGDYETYLLSELRAVLEAKYSISAHGIAGKSSGGYGAIVHAMRHPGLFRAVACHSGDMGFRLAYTGDIAALANAVHDNGGVEAFVRKFDQALKKKDGRFFGPISALALASVYSPDTGKPLGIALPFDFDKAEIDEVVFSRWLAMDPVNLIELPQHQEALKQMKLVFVDCGRRDEYQLHWGARSFHRKLERIGIPHIYEEFDDGHRSTSYRLDESLPRIYAALTT